MANPLLSKLRDLANEPNPLSGPPQGWAEWNLVARAVFVLIAIGGLIGLAVAGSWLNGAVRGLMG